MNRALRAATVGVLLFSPLAVSACSSGQVNQTASQVRDKVGPTAHVGAIELRKVLLAYPSSGVYAQGDDAELQMAIVNSGAEDDALIGIRGTDFRGVRVTGSPTGTASPSSATPTSAAPTSSDGTGGVNIPIRADSVLYLGENGPTVTLVDLTRPIDAAQTIPITFTFQRAGEVTVQAQVAPPSNELPRGEAYDFHPPTEANVPGAEGGSGDRAQQRETHGNG